jgi:3-methyladenine DNA glycosylase AlkD
MNYLQTYYNLLAEHRSDKADAMRAYMKDNFEFLGVSAPQRKVVEKAFYKQYGLPKYEDLADIITDAWATDEREIQYFAMDLVERMRKQWQPDIIYLMEMMIVKKSWWDTVDFIASHLIGQYFEQFPATMTAKTGAWNTSDNLWLQRTSIIFQLFYKNKTNTELLFAHICTHTASRDFFIQKAIGWALRQHAYTDAALVKDFVARTELANLSRREALKRL